MEQKWFVIRREDKNGNLIGIGYRFQATSSVEALKAFLENEVDDKGELMALPVKADARLTVEIWNGRNHTMFE